MSDVSSTILQWINAHTELAGLATFGISAAESVAIIGTIIPGTVMMTAIGTLAGAGVIPLWQTILWAILGAIVGDGISYWIGRHYNARLPQLWPFYRYPALLENGEHFFRKYGSMSVFIGRFVGPVRALVPLVAGMLGLKPLRFYIANIVSAIGWAPAYMLPGILLGAASLELPTDVAVHVIFMLFVTIFLIMFIIWFIQKMFRLIGKHIDKALTQRWIHMTNSAFFKPVTQLLKHHDHQKSHGQLILTTWFIVLGCALLYLLIYVMFEGSQHIAINDIVFHFFRSIRTPSRDNIMLALTFLGDKKVLLPVMVILFGWLIFRKYTYTAWHVLALGILAAGGIEILKLLAHSSRPWGLVHNSESFSFPSGHTTLTVIFYTGLTLLLMQLAHIKHRRFIYYLVTLLILAVSASRLYLGVHWFTDVLGGWLLGSSVLLLVAISYNRQKNENIKPGELLSVALIALILCYGQYALRHFNSFKQDYALLERPVVTLSQDAWWLQQGKNLPFYRTNRFGLSTQILNLQWLGSLTDIENILLTNGWQIPPKNDWIDVLHRLTDVNSTEHLPLVSPIYLDKKPALTLVKWIQGGKKLVVLRLWESRIVIQNAAWPLQLGSVEVVPRTYSWLFKRKATAIALTPVLLFTHMPANYELKEITVHLNSSFHPQTQYMLLIKPK